MWKIPGKTLNAIFSNHTFWVRVVKLWKNYWTDLLQTLHTSLFNLFLLHEPQYTRKKICMSSWHHFFQWEKWPKSRHLRSNPCQIIQNQYFCVNWGSCSRLSSKLTTFFYNMLADRYFSFSLTTRIFHFLPRNSTLPGWDGRHFVYIHFLTMKILNLKDNKHVYKISNRYLW